MENQETKLIFDERGYLVPALPIIVELYGNPLQALQKWHKNQSFINKDENRQKMWAQFMLYNTCLTNIIGNFAQNGIEQWLDGSFTTLKKQPNDIDLVTFIKKDIATSYKHDLASLKSDIEANFIDDYIVETVENTHKNYIIYQSDRAYWYDLFTKTKRNLRTNKQYHKGFLHFKYLSL